MLHKNLSTNKAEHLTFAGADTVELAQKYGTPLMILDEEGIRENCRKYLAAAKKHFGVNARVLYASKALCFAGIYKILREEGMGADVVSMGEMYTAVAGGFGLANAYFHGNYRTDEEFRYAIKNKIGCIVIDNFDEAQRINEIAGDIKVCAKQKVLIRLIPSIDPHTHAKIVTGGADSKFGVSIDDGTAEKLIKHILTLKNIELHGFHCHIGSQIFDIAPFCDAAITMLNFIVDIKNKIGFETRELNLGGGFGVRYIEQQPELDCENIIAAVAKQIKSAVAANGIKMPAIVLEPGRSIVAANGLTLYKVGAVKQITKVKSAQQCGVNSQMIKQEKAILKQYVIVDGSMADNPRYALYNSPYTILLGNRAGGNKTDIKNADPENTFTVAGRTCESGDIIQENVFLPKPQSGDILAVTVTGAYNYSMASNYNRLTRPPVVMIDKKGRDRIVITRESLDNLIRLDKIEN